MSDESRVLAHEKVRQETIELIDNIEQVSGGDFHVGTVLIVADVTCVVDGETVNPVVFQCSDPRRWVQAALLREAVDAADAANEQREADAHDLEDDDR